MDIGKVNTNTCLKLPTNTFRPQTEMEETAHSSTEDSIDYACFLYFIKYCIYNFLERV